MALLEVVYLVSWTTGVHGSPLGLLVIVFLGNALTITKEKS